MGVLHEYARDQSESGYLPRANRFPSHAPQLRPAGNRIQLSYNRVLSTKNQDPASPVPLQQHPFVDGQHLLTLQNPRVRLQIPLTFHTSFPALDKALAVSLFLYAGQLAG